MTESMKEPIKLERKPPIKTPEQLAQFFHETYEALAPIYSYKTREASAKPWADVPEQNKNLMIAVCAQVMVRMMANSSEITAKQGEKS